LNLIVKENNRNQNEDNQQQGKYVPIADEILNPAHGKICHKAQQKSNVAKGQKKFYAIPSPIGVPMF
jgi:hypothetical protein